MLGFSRPSADIESRVNRLYRAFATTAKRYRYTFRRPEITPGGKPTVVFLGNHSSGKSTIVNDLLGDPPVQDTGVAPTDDAFTVLVHGEDEHEFYGPAALGQLPSEFQALRALGPDFLQHFAVKVRNREFLKGVNLVDSPGMIDTPEGSAARAYDFPAAVRAFTELSDLVLFLFDPEKPGTTGETVDVLSSCLHGIEFKLRVLLNKADTFDSMEDYARAYGTLCWNLARVLRTKDLPPIFSTYTPSTGARLAARASGSCPGGAGQQLPPEMMQRLAEILLQVSPETLATIAQKLSQAGGGGAPSAEDAPELSLRDLLALQEMLEDLTPEQAGALVGHELYLPLDLLPKLDGNRFYFHEVVGFRVVDSQHGDIGTIEQVIEYPAQPLFQVMKNGTEILIPVIDEVIDNVDRTNKTIYITAPNGLIDLYLSDTNK